MRNIQDGALCDAARRDDPQGICAVTTQRVAGERISFAGFYHLLRDSLFYWNKGKAFVYAAALAYYTIFSIVPLIVFVVGIAGQMAGARQLELQLMDLLAQQAGAAPAQFVSDIVLEGDAAYQSVVA